VKVTYDTYYQTENLFGKPYPELIDFFKKYPQKGKILDLGCGQGRDAIALTLMKFDVTGIDNSKVGIEQMNQIAKVKNLSLKGIVKDIYEYTEFNKFDFVLLDSMFHFQKKDKKKETDFIKRIISNVKKGCIIIFCIQDTGKKIEILNEVIESGVKLDKLIDKKFEYLFEDSESGHKSKTNYRLLAVKK